MAVNPTLVTDPDAVCDLAAGYVDEAKCHERVTLPNRTYVELVQKLSEAEADEIESHDLSGVSLYRNQWRYYPGGVMSARAVGFVGYTADGGNELRGKYGLERQYDDILYRNDDVLSVNFFAELFSNLGELVPGNDTVRSGDVVTTLEPSVSRMLDNCLLYTSPSPRDLSTSRMPSSA